MSNNINESNNNSNNSNKEKGKTMNITQKIIDTITQFATENNCEVRISPKVAGADRIEFMFGFAEYYRDKVMDNASAIKVFEDAAPGSSR